jgi:uncharacterized protein YndB with AHSA1/START domain
MGAYADFTTYADETAARLSSQALVFEVTRHFDVTQIELFAYIADFDRLSEWIMGAKKSWADDSNAAVPSGVGSVRMIQPYVGNVVRETVKAHEAPRMLAYSADDSALFGLCTDHLSVITCEPHPDGGTIMCWQAYGRLAPGAVKSWAGTKLFQTALTASMKNLERRFPTR